MCFIIYNMLYLQSMVYVYEVWKDLGFHVEYNILKFNDYEHLVYNYVK